MAERRGPSVPLNDLVLTVARELAQAAGDATSLQSLIALDRVAQADDRAFMTSEQNLDRLTQELSALSTFMRALADMVPNHVHVDPSVAAGELLLGRLKERLSGREPPQHRDQNDIEFF